MKNNNQKLLITILLSAIVFLQNAVAKSATISESLTIKNIESNSVLPDLAKQVLLENKSSNLPIRQIIALELVAKQYHKANASIDELTEQSRLMNPWITLLYTIHYKAYVDAKLKQEATHQIFEKAFKAALFENYNKVDDRYKVYVVDSFAGNLVRQESLLTQMLKKFSAQSQMSSDDNKALVLQFNAWSMLNQMQPFAQKFLQEQLTKDLVIKENITIKTSDGASLQATVFLPMGVVGKLPSVLIYNLYAEGWSIDNKAKEAAMSGYAGVLVWSRGKGASKDKIMPFEHEATDAYDIIEWISKQPWSNQKVGMYGGSYLGFTQWAATKKLHPALKTIVPSTAVVPGFNDNLTENGVLSTSSLSWFHLVGNNSTMDFATYYDPRWGKTPEDWYQQGSSFKELDKVDGHENSLFQRWLQHPDYDEYWQSMVPYKKDFAGLDIPILSITGYFDHAQHGSLYFFNEHYKYNKDAEHYLLIGPYDHLGAASMPRPTVSGYQIDPLAHISIDKVIYEWFDYVLKGKNMPAKIKDKINYQVMGANQWRHAPNIDAMSNSSIKFYLNNAGKSGAQSLDKNKPAIDDFLKQEVDFSDRKTTNRSLSSKALGDKVYVDNGFKFVSEPVKQPFILNGVFSGELNITINKKDMDVVLVLYEKLEDGRYFQLSHFKGRASYVNDRSKRELLNPNGKQTIAFSNTHMTSRKISKGSRLILILNANKNSNDQINYGSGKAVNDETIEDAKDPLQVKWHNDSFIKLPVLINSNES